MVFDGKQDLERQLVRRIRAFCDPDAAFVVLRDQGAAECKAVRGRLAALVAEAGRGPTLIRVACRELESWILGDWPAVAQAFGDPKLAAQANKALYRDPDSLAHPVQELRKFLPGYQKRDGARRVGPLLDVARNRSNSFRAFCSGLQRLVSAASPLRAP
jgi:hypothetical protein